MENKRTFLKKDQLQLINGGYLSDMDNNPVSNAKFVEAQRYAEYIVTFAKMAKEKDFIGKPADNLMEFKREVENALSTKDTQYIKKVKEPESKIGDKLAKEALEFISYTEQSQTNNSINSFLQQFNIINDFEEFGLFFDQEIVKLNKIYTMNEIIKAVTSVIDSL